MIEDITPEQILPMAERFRELIETKAWKEYSAILRAQIAEREDLLHRPLHDLQSPNLLSGDFFGRAAAAESIKGAIIGLSLALSIPLSTIQHADDISRENGASNGGTTE